MHSGFIAGLLLLIVPPVRAEQPSLRAAPPSVLQVPYLAQTELLCGGAAIAMVERWWGRRGVYAEDFASLVRPDSGGILTTELVDATRARGWRTDRMRGTAALVRESLRDSVPVVALIRVAARRYHYIVIVGWRDGRVVYHDPAVGPFLSIPEARFEQRWAGADRWMLIVRPPLADTAAPRAALPPTDSLPCRPFLDQAADAAAIGRFEEGERLLLVARASCPLEPLVDREMAGLRFRQGRQVESMALIERYLRNVPDDPLAWQLLGTSLFLSGRGDGALGAWNHLGRPTVDLVVIEGLERIRYAPVADAVSLPHGTMLTANRLALARRRVDDLPALSGSQVAYRPLPDGLAEVSVDIVERKMVPPLWQLAIVNGIGAAAQHRIRLAVSSPTGAGEQWQGSWRWDLARPRLALRVAFPVRVALPGVLSIETARERFRFAVTDRTERVVNAERHSSGASFQAWVTPTMRPSLAMRLEQWPGTGDFFAVTLGNEMHLAADHLILSGFVDQGASLSAGTSYRRAAARAMWASSRDLEHAGWSARIGVDQVSSSTPLGLWPMLGNGSTPAIPLRAHQLVHDGFLLAQNVGEEIIHGGVAGDHPLLHVGPVIVAVGGFLDAARIVRPASGPGASVLYLDGGGGIRLAIAGRNTQVLRIDLAKSLRGDHRLQLSAGIHTAWPFFH